jgi:sporulation protein YlmC with PRC-barrel domain
METFMKSRPMISTGAAYCALTTLAVAQTVAPVTPSSTMPTPTMPITGTSQEGMRMAERANVAVKFVTVKPADVMSSKIVGANIYNNQNDSVGEIEDLVIDNGKTITGVVVSVGGFLGLGESYVVLDPSTIVLNQKDGKWKAFVDTSKDNLKNAPKFTYSKK